MTSETSTRNSYGNIHGTYAGIGGSGGNNRFSRVDIAVTVAVPVKVDGYTFDTVFTGT